MKPIKFKDQNTTFAKDQPEYGQLPALVINSPQGEVISCWKLSFREKVKILFTGKLWVSLMMFGKPLTPSMFSVNHKDLYTRGDGVNNGFKLTGITIKRVFTRRVFGRTFEVKVPLLSSTRLWMWLTRKHKSWTEKN